MFISLIIAGCIAQSRETACIKVWWIEKFGDIVHSWKYGEPYRNGDRLLRKDRRNGRSRRAGGWRKNGGGSSNSFQAIEKFGSSLFTEAHKLFFWEWCYWIPILGTSSGERVPKGKYEDFSSHQNYTKCKQVMTYKHDDDDDDDDEGCCSNLGNWFSLVPLKLWISIHLKLSH